MCAVCAFRREYRNVRVRAESTEFFEPFLWGGRRALSSAERASRILRSGYDRGQGNDFGDSN